MAKFFSAALFIFFVAGFASISLACMAMQPTHPSLTRPPLLTTTTTATTTEVPTTTSATSTSSSTTSQTTTASTTTSTTTVPPPSCISCTAPKYMAPAFCPLDSSCNEAPLYMTVQMPCIAATCTGGSQMFATKEGMPEIAILDMGIQCKADGVTFEDIRNPTASFPAATATVYCKKSCAQPAGSAKCTPAQMATNTCAAVMVVCQNNCFLACPGTFSVFINDQAATGHVVCTAGVWGLDGTPLPTGFTAYCQ